MSCSESWEGGGTRGRRRRGRQELNNLLCYWLMLHCRHLELIAALFSSPPHSFALLYQTLSRHTAVRVFPLLPPPSLHAIHPFPILSRISSLRLPWTVAEVQCVCMCVCVHRVLYLSVTRELTTCGNEWVSARESWPAQLELTLPFHGL